MRVVACTAVMLAVVAVGCGGNSSEGSDLLHDAGGNAYDVREMLDGRMWMTGNLNLDLPNSYCYGGVASECLRFGRLYTWTSAGEACRLLGPMWRLPTDHEWRQMAREYGGVRGDSEEDGQAAYKVLRQRGMSGFNAALGGSRESDGTYARIDDHGFYWTATETDMNTAWFYNFGRGAELLNRHGWRRQVDGHVCAVHQSV
jgi:uncharacterized protein (TIGR02145 family)